MTNNWSIDDQIHMLLNQYKGATINENTIKQFENPFRDDYSQIDNKINLELSRSNSKEFNEQIYASLYPTIMIIKHISISPL